MALTNKTNIRKRTVMDGLKKTFGKASQAISEKVGLKWVKPVRLVF